MDEWSILIPAFNEEKRIANTINTLWKEKSIKQIIVVNDGSIDNTSQVARQAGAHVVDLHNNKGKGTALNEGSKYLVNNFIAFIDADLEEKACEITKLIEPITTNIADISIAIFPKATCKGGVGLAKTVSSMGINFLTGQKMSAPLSGQRAMTKDVMNKLMPFSQRFGVEVGMTIDAARLGLRIIEVPTNMGHAETGRDWKGFYHRGKQLKDISCTILNRAIRRI